MQPTRNLLIALAVLSVSTTVASAGVVDTPLPVLVTGEKTYHLYTVPFITSQGGLDTFFSCTSMDTVDIQVGVETFLSLGGGPANDAAATSLTVAPGRMVTFATGSALAFSVDSTVFPCASCRGSARILATSKKLACTAFVADAANIPPASAWQLTIIAKTKQKAAN
jgi:hypothetical protein